MNTTRGWRRLLLTIGLTAAAAIPAQGADSPWLYGIHWYGEPGGSIVETMTGNKGIWSLEVVQTNSDFWWGAQWQRDNRFQTMIDRGHTIIIRIERNWGETVPYPGNLAQYLADVQAAAQTLANVCHIWQIGNEMNLYAEWGGNELTAANYVSMFKQIRAAIKAVPSPLGEQIVLLGPVSPGGVQAGVRHTDGNVYLAQMCDLLTPDDVDGFGLHSYAAPWNGVTVSRMEFQGGYISQLAIIDDKGFASKPVHITEWNRRVENTGSPYTDEANSAQFLHGAFADLHAWNQTPGAHPVSSACWFIYQEDPGWLQYSIESLHSIGPGGSDNDLYDAFQYACTQDYPTGTPSGSAVTRMYGGTPTGTNVARTATASADSMYNAANAPAKAIDGVVAADSKWTSTASSATHWLRLDLGAEYPLSGMIVRHAGAGGEPAYYNTDVFQLQTAPSAGGPWEMDASIYNGSQENVTGRRYYVPRFTRHVRLYITDPGIDNYARIPEFEVYAAILGDLDEDGDVDLADYARFQACFGGADVARREPECFAGHFDADDDVDGADAAGFVNALTGPAS